jgi:hypothetical protein
VKHILILIKGMELKLSMIDLSTESHLHGWGPKLAARYLNMNANNAYKIYCVLYNKYHPGRTPMEMKDCINNLTHSLLQQGNDIRQRGYGAAPSATNDLTTSVGSDGRKKRTDANNQPFTSPAAAHGTGLEHLLLVVCIIKKFLSRKKQRLYFKSSSTNTDAIKRNWGEKW